MFDLHTIVSEKLTHANIRSVSDWTTKYRVMGDGPWSFNRSPWTKEMCDSAEELVIGQKAAQLGYTEVALNKTFYTIDVLRRSVLYILPATSPDSSDFSTSRFDPALELSPHLSKLFTDVQNIGHKRAGNANLFIRGSRSRSGMKSLPVATMIFDEVDEMTQENIPLAFERSSGQEERQAFMISTPTIENHGINAFFNDSTQDHYYFKCPHCSRHTELIFPDCLTIPTDNIRSKELLKTHLTCKECKHVLDHATKSSWLSNDNAGWHPSFEDRMSRGFYINQLYSIVLPPWKLAEAYLKSLTNPASEQEFYNSKLGLTHTVDGARVTDEAFDNCLKNYKTQLSYEGDSIITLGIDVGKKLHYEVNQWVMSTSNLNDNDINLFAKPRVLAVGAINDFEDLDKLMIEYNVTYAVVDRQPETRKSLEFCQRHWGRAMMCFYGNGVSGKQINQHKEQEHTVTVDRTSWLDLSMSRFHRHNIDLPINIPIDYRQHIKALTRIYKEDRDGNQIGRYVHGQDPDHYAHARNYNEIAFKLAALNISGGNITGVY